MQRQNNFIAVALVFLVTFISQFHFNLIFNEADVLPFARHQFDHDWIPGDWYLNLDIGYRAFFDYAFGWLYSQTNLLTTLVIGRCLTYVLFAILAVRLFRLLDLPLLWMLILLAYYLPNYQVAAGEWMIGGLETKPFAYLALLWALDQGFRKRLGWAWFALGAALSFHLLIGVYGALGWGLAMAANRDYRAQWKKTLLRAWPYAISGAWGIYGVSQYLLGKSAGLNADFAWEIYTQWRVPHHVIPDWKTGNWILYLALMLILLWVHLRNPRPSIKWYGAFLTGPVLLWVTGLVLYYTADVSLMRFYWFRMADTLLVFLVPPMLVRHLGDILPFRKWMQHLGPRTKNRGTLPTHLRLAGWIAFIAVFAVMQQKQLGRLLQPENLSQQHFREKIDFSPDISQWIREDTPVNSTVLIPPGLTNFYITAERARVVSFKHSPQRAEDILEWFNRMEALNGGRTITQKSYKMAEEVGSNFERLSSEQITQLAKTYNSQYLLTSANTDYSFPITFKSGGYKVYRLNPQ